MNKLTNQSVDINKVLIQERNKEIEKITHQMHKIKDIFQDLTKLIDDQDEDIQTTKKNAEETLKRTEKGLQELKKANDLSK